MHTIATPPVKPAGHDPDDATGHPLLKAAGLADRFGFHLRLAQAAAWSDLVAALQPFGLRPGGYSVLLILRAAPGSRQQDIGAALGIQRPNLVTMIDGMEKRGLIRRAVDPADRRAYALSLTDVGAKLLAAADVAHAAHEARLAERLGDIDAGALLPALRRIAALRPGVEP
ncbi:MAG: transcriptional regulator, MarR family [Sphingomonas bacterium]|jgi:DNA-binding MarR family transcriptional regulator|nr:MarR family transcriptional regulator [Sphingomonas bacterium]MDB5689811.1 transcriptional regulator, MarR family [Sphingomonas bacterium]